MAKIKLCFGLKNVTKVAGLVWAGCIFGVAIVFTIGIVGNFFDKPSNVIVIILLGFILVGSLSFSVACLSFALGKLREYRSEKQNWFVSISKVGLILLFFPVYLFFLIIKPIHAIKLRFISLLAVVFIVFPIWAGGYLGLYVLGKEQLNLTDDSIPLAGTGSMYPTFPKKEGNRKEQREGPPVAEPLMRRYPTGLVLFGRRILGHKIGKGDIVVFTNGKTEEITSKDGEPTGMVKRVIGLPGDKLEIRSGVLYFNGEAQKEPYIARARSTFGGSFLSECKPYKVPEGKLFVMGDNRKGSGDSRHELGIIDYVDIDHVIPWQKQIGNLDKNWRDTSQDLEESAKIRLDKDKYLSLLNGKRKEAKVRPLKYQPKLEKSSFKRGEIILKYDDFSYEATRSGFTQLKAMDEVGYSNIVWNEVFTQGNYEADELIEYFFEFPEWKKFFLNKDFQELGIAEVKGEINGCPTQVIVQQFAGYVPPDYAKDIVDSWKSLLDNLKRIQPEWQELKSYSKIYNDHKSEVDRINEIIGIRIANTSAIVTRMEANKWLTAVENKMMDQDVSLSQEQNSLADKLNSY